MPLKHQALIDKMQDACTHKQISGFRLNVLSQLLKIPPGQVTTYGLLAKSINCHSAQAIGQALKANPWAPHVPCHRVIKSDLRIGGFFGQRSGIQINKKLSLLDSEGVFFDKDGILLDSTAIFNFE
ncbi:MGMT family protein [Lentisphaera profundi]|uniref:MGMT family protein n=1 Tax=Lentisphaera profundi TaxID=1658616 RepID=A0ABY7VRH0_9BACT|nr:MGMT family protein [Lentisphaera profundi]WDE95924.1 MGMT family protein [Lentisphaera profundi]